jgi:hypothetical protein
MGDVKHDGSSNKHAKPRKLTAKELRDQRRWDHHVMSLHASSTMSWFDCVNATIKELGLRPGGMEGVPG